MGGAHSFELPEKPVYRPPQEHPAHLAWKEYATATFSLYDTEEVKSPKHIAITGFVQNDGSGDYYIMLQLAERVHELFSKAKITLYAEVEDMRSRKRTFPIDDRFQTLFSGTVLRKEQFVDEEPVKDKALRKAAEAIARKADLHIEAPHMCQTTRLYQTLAPPPLRFLELCSNLIHREDLLISDKEKLPIYSMGLGDSEFGLNFVPPPKGKPSLDSLQCPSLKAKLKEIGPSTLYFMYFSHDSTLKYRHFLEKRLLDSQDGCTFVNATKYTIMSEYSKYNRADYLKVVIPDHIRVVKTYLLDAKGEIVSGETIKGPKEDGICVHIFETYPLPHQDILTLMALAKEPIGCTGNMSLLETLSYDKLPDFELRKLGGRGIITGFIYRIEQFFRGEAPHLHTYFSNLFYGRFQGAELLEDPHLYEQWKALLAHLREEHNFNKVLPRILHKALVMQKHPTFSEKERKIARKVVERRITPSKAIAACKGLFAKYVTPHEGGIA